MLGPLCTLHRKILCGDRRYVTQYFDTKQAGRRIFEICVYRLGNFDEHTMTPRQDGGFFAGLKMSQLGTSQDFRHRIFLERREACRRTPTRARRRGKTYKRSVIEPGFFPGPPPARKIMDGGCAGEPGFSHMHHPRREKKQNECDRVKIFP